MVAKFVVSLTVAAVVAGGYPQGFPEKRNQRIPDFIMTTTKGQRITRRDLKGKVVLLDFWATWCGPCRQSSPAMQKLWQRYGKKGLVVIGADVEPTIATAKGYAAEHHYSYTFTYDNQGLEQSLEIQGIPAFALLDKKGVIRQAIEGIPNSSDPVQRICQFFGPQIEKLLAERS